MPTKSPLFPKGCSKGVLWTFGKDLGFTLNSDQHGMITIRSNDYQHI